MLTFLALRKIFKWIFRLLLVFFSLSLLWVVAYRFINPPTTILMQSRNSEFAYKQSSYRQTQQYVWVEYDNISNNLKMAVICGEDQRFKEHFGFDLKAIQKAIQHNIKGGQVRGASTISQQTAKNVFLWEGRSWTRKGLEVWFTFLIECCWSKERILEVYLNVIELGPIESEGKNTAPLFGVEAASQHYFKKSCSSLTKIEAAKIASILPCPRSCGMNSSFSMHHRNLILRSMNRWGRKLML